MGAKDVLSRKSGVIVGDDVLKLFNYAQEHKFAIPAIVRTSIPSASDSTNTMAERYILLNRCCFTRGCPRCQVPNHPPNVPRWCRLLRRKGTEYSYTIYNHTEVLTNSGCCQR
jgi:hypothetical protein